METLLNRETDRGNARLLALTGLFAALGCVGTMVLQIPSPTGGYMNLGDAVVILGAWLLGPVYGAVAGGVGPALADLLSGYAVYVPATLVIKALMALTAAWLYRALGKRGLLLSALAAEVPMVLGYWLFDGALAALSGGGALGLCLAARRAFPAIWSRPPSARRRPRCWRWPCGGAAMSEGGSRSSERRKKPAPKAMPWGLVFGTFSSSRPGHSTRPRNWTGLGRRPCPRRRSAWQCRSS